MVESESTVPGFRITTLTEPNGIRQSCVLLIRYQWRMRAVLQHLIATAFLWKPPLWNKRMIKHLTLVEEITGLFSFPTSKLIWTRRIPMRRPRRFPCPRQAEK